MRRVHDPCRAAQVILGYEEAIGFMPGAMFRDKDGVATAVAFCELAAHLYASGSSLQAHLEGLYRRYGRPAFRCVPAGCW